MAESNSLDALFAKGKNYTSEQFVDQYNKLKESEKNKEETSSIFKGDNDFAITAMFSTLDTNKDNKLDDKELEALRALDTKDGNDVLSDADIKILLDNTLKSLESTCNKSAADMYKEAVEGGKLTNYARGGEISAETYTRMLSDQIATIMQLMEMRENESKTKIQGYQNQLDSLVRDKSNLTLEEKTSYAKTSQELKTTKKELENKQKKLKEKQYEIEMDKAEIKYLDSHRKDGDDTDAKIARLQNRINGLTTACTELEKGISELNTKISRQQESQDKLVNKAKTQTSEIAGKIDEIKQSMERERTSFKTENDRYKIQLSNLQSAQDYAAQQLPSSYSDSGDYTEFEGNGKELQDLWRKKWTKELGEAKADAKIKELGGEAFFTKVCAIAKEINCNPNELMGVMNSESGVTTKERNPHGGATGLIQFMPSTAKSLGTTTAALSQMGAIQQLDYVKDFYIKNKKAARFGANEKVDTGALYALTFLPAYAKREVLAVKGHKYYDWNKGIDVNNDGQITKSDLAAQVRKKMA